MIGSGDGSKLVIHLVCKSFYAIKKGGEQAGLVKDGACMINPLQPPHNEKFIKKIGLIK